MQINPYLLYDGNCEAAFSYYAKVLGGRIDMMMTHDSAPASMQVAPDWQKKIMHAQITIDDEVLMASDAPPGHFSKPQGFSVSLRVAEPAEAERVFQALAEAGSVTMPIAQTFWARRFGMCVDQFGIPWMVNCE